MLLTQADVRTMKTLIFCQGLNDLNHTHKVLGFLSLKAHKFFKTENLFFSIAYLKTKCFLFLNKIEQTVFEQEKKKLKSF